MTTETDKQAQEAADEAAGFSAGFNDEAPAAPAPQEPAKAEAEAKEPAAAEEKAPEQAPAPLTADEIAALRAAASELPTLKAQLRDASGHIGGLKSRVGELSDQLKLARTQKEAEEKPAVLTPVELKRLADKYPELAAELTPDITDLLATLKPKEEPVVDLTQLVKDGVAEQLLIRDYNAAAKRLAQKHPDIEQLKNDQKFREWVDASVPAAEREEFLNTKTDADLVIKVLDAYKAHRDGASKAKEKSQERLAAAVTPEGVSRPGKTTLSDDEAMRKGFAEGFNS